MKKITSIIIAMIVLLALCGSAYYLLSGKTTIYYTKIDNTKIEKLSSKEEMKYEYTLVAYNKNGKKKTVKFKTVRELKNNAYLELEVIRLSGVHSWKEVQWENLPPKVQEKYKK